METGKATDRSKADKEDHSSVTECSFTWDTETKHASKNVPIDETDSCETHTKGTDYSHHHEGHIVPKVDESQQNRKPKTQNGKPRLGSKPVKRKIPPFDPPSPHGSKRPTAVVNIACCHRTMAIPPHPHNPTQYKHRVASGGCLTNVFII